MCLKEITRRKTIYSSIFPIFKDFMSSYKFLPGVISFQSEELAWRCLRVKVFWEWSLSSNINFILDIMMIFYIILGLCFLPLSNNAINYSRILTRVVLPEVSAMHILGLWGASTLMRYSLTNSVCWGSVDFPLHQTCCFYSYSPRAITHFIYLGDLSMIFISSSLHTSGYSKSLPCLVCYLSISWNHPATSSLVSVLIL